MLVRQLGHKMDFCSSSTMVAVQLVYQKPALAPLACWDDTVCSFRHGESVCSDNTHSTSKYALPVHSSSVSAIHAIFFLY